LPGARVNYARTRAEAFDEAEPLADRGRELSEDNDATSQAMWRQVQALVRAHRGEHEDAERLAREAVDIAEATDGLAMQRSFTSQL